MPVRMDFNVVLLAIIAVTGVIWAVGAVIRVRRRREKPEPETVAYARSIFQVAVAVLLLRSFVFEPFRIPSDSMMPTLCDGDFILVDKFAYGLRLPLTNIKFLRTGEPRRGDVVVFHPPMDPSQVWIKRVIGLPGDHVLVRNDRVVINGRAMPFQVTGTYGDGCYEHMQIANEQIGMHEHQALLCPQPLQVTRQSPPTCARGDARGYFCGGSPPADALALPEQGAFDMVVPPGEYMMMGDNRDNSDDSRYWGFVTERELIGKATTIWFSWDPYGAGGPIWSRLGLRIR